MLSSPCLFWTSFWIIDSIVNDGRVSNLPIYKNTAHAISAIARIEVRFTL